MITRDDNRVTVNLTIPFLVWMGFWWVFAALVQSWTLVVVGALPLFFIAGFFMLFLLLLLVVMPYMYLRGVPIRVTWRGREKVYRRGLR